MSDDSRTAMPGFSGSVNIAMKIPRAQYDATVAFYRDVLDLPVTDVSDSAIATGVSRSHRCEFGPNTLWLDEVENYSRSDLWLQVDTDDIAAAMDRLAAAGVTPQDELEPLPDTARAHWITNPAGIVHLVGQKDL
ncbi:putative enzyme related to lactoylglutathione lyase [Nocardioides thalensis]|uniref:Putative enzyme related to lactoylglutathione lyase n=1 Tax=Nocardioides thalensis TaxID=1914755 RepID=A0A853CB36_9ACTN|nr:VOC family protein [Nocardioides thalensis]NYJ03628.1 putative enzyme related to lactoylglutathione lyase [Nocardioides thalensis]